MFGMSKGESERARAGERERKKVDSQLWKRKKRNERNACWGGEKYK
jgi:hypothetical protein